MGQVKAKKDLIRKGALEKLKFQREEHRRKKSLAVKELFFGLEELKKAERILLYFGKHYEVDTEPIIKEALLKGKKVFLPVTDTKRKRLIISEVSDIQKDIEVGPYGIRQPKAAREINPKTLDLCVVPGLCFDRKGNRLGHGSGYYDRFLKDAPTNIPRIGLAFDFQLLVRDIPVLSFDIPVTRIITN